MSTGDISLSGQAGLFSSLVIDSGAPLGRSFEPLSFLHDYIVQTPEWTESNTCDRCGTAFFWNLKEMWATKQLAVNRQVSVGASRDYEVEL